MEHLISHNDAESQPQNFQPPNQIGLQDGLQIPFPNPAGLEAVPEPGLIYSKDDEKMNSESHYELTPMKGQRYCGLKPRTLLILAIATVLVVAAVAVGAGVGASRHSSSSKSASSTPAAAPAQTVTVTGSSSSAHLAVPTAASLTADAALPSATVDSLGGCKNGTIYNTTNNTPFEEYCDHDFRVGSHFNTTAADWMQTNSPTFKGCMEACAFDRSQ